MKFFKLLLLITITTFMFNSCTTETIEDDEMENTSENNNSNLFERHTLKHYIVTFPEDSTFQERNNFSSSIIDMSSGEGRYIGESILIEHWQIYEVIDLGYQPPNPFGFGTECVKCVRIQIPEDEAEKGGKLNVSIYNQIPLL